MRKKKKKGTVRYLHPGRLAGEIRRYGETFSVWKYVQYFLALYGTVLVLSWGFRLKLPGVVFLLAAVTCLVPGIFLMVYRERYEERKFQDAASYIEQLLYSFKRRAKILNALEDTLLLFEKDGGRMYGGIFQAIRYIQTAEAGENIYREALGFIEREYGCERLYQVHDFLVEAEQAGGDFTKSADILLQDRRLWVDRVMELKREKQNVKIKITIGIGLSFLICGMTVAMLPKEFGITENVVSQVVTVGTVFVNLLIWYLAQSGLSRSLLETEENQDFEEVKGRYEFVMHREMSREKRKYFFLASGLLPMMIFFGLAGKMTEAWVTVLLMAVIITQPGRRYKAAIKRVTKAVEKAFPNWLMSMSLRLQTDNVHVSLAKSIPQAPVILREELGNLLEGIEREPDSAEPYLGFMERVSLPDVKSAMKVLYSMAEFGAMDIGDQIGPLVERGAVMMDKAERMKAEDYIAGISFLVLLPMITGVLKMLADLALVIVYILSSVNAAV